jgi:ABC-2 type transport system ATP-binding protein
MATIAAPGVVVSLLADGAIEITGLTAEQVAVAASGAGIVLHEVASVSGSLEEAYIALTAGEVEYRSSNITQEGAVR